MDAEKYIILTDQQLVALSQDGDNVAFGCLFERYRKSVYQIYLQRTGGNADDADDLLQETFVKVFLKIHLYKPEYTFGQWVYAIARNNFIDYLRKKHDTLPLDRMERSCTPYNDRTDPEFSFITEQNKSTIEGFLSRMSPAYRDIINLRYFCDLSYEEIAAKLEMPLGTVKTQLHRARERLCRFIREESDILP